MNRTYIKTVLGLLFMAVMITACGPGKAEQQKKQQEDLAKEVIAVHDEVMPQMGELVKLRKQLKEKLNVWNEPATVDSARAQKATLLVADLDAADKGMMDWMHTYNGGEGLYDHDAVMAYLTDEKTKITTVKENMNKSMDAAKQFLEENK